MEFILPVVMLLLGLGLGAGVCRLIYHAKIQHVASTARNETNSEVATLKVNLENRENENKSLKVELANTQNAHDKLFGEYNELRAKAVQLQTTIEQERRQSKEKLELLNQAQVKLSDTFKALSANALKDNNDAFLKLAQESLSKFQEGAKGDLEKRQIAIDSLVKPVEKSLKQVDEKLQDIERKRLEAYSGLIEQVKGLTETQKELRSETSNLVKALRRPDVRGRWGEIQLKRVVEMAGMLEHCDFFQQQSVATEEGVLRPDLLVKLPGGKNIVVDSKVPLNSFLEGIESNDDETRLASLRDHARLVRSHIQNLGKKSYFAQFEHAPEFVVLFLPGEVFFSSALEHDPALIEMGVEQNVIIATPTTLIALLKAVAYGWTQERLAENAKDISELGKELYSRLSQMGDHLAKVGKSLENATKAYNSAIGSLESRVLVSARKFDELHVTVSDKDLDPLPAIEQIPRAIQATELRGQDQSDETGTENSS
ncbi:MAG: DNA recombination protein RmuC [Myxococcota bacterium]|nr:DNA recombination protein RmuC [Myxococcota bacterium]